MKLKFVLISGKRDEMTLHRIVETYNLDEEEDGRVGT